MQPAGEIGGMAVFVSDRFQVDGKAGCFVVAGSVAAFDLDLDLAPDIIAPLYDGVQPGGCRRLQPLFPLAIP